MSRAGRSAQAITSIRISAPFGSTDNEPSRNPQRDGSAVTKSKNTGRKTMQAKNCLFTTVAVALCAVAIALACSHTASAGDTPKRGGTLTYMIPADGPPSLDGHREATYA